jgi:uncharacterized protein YaeQ
LIGAFLLGERIKARAFYKIFFGKFVALKSIIYKAQLQIADMDRGVYADHGLTLALHPSETEERLLIRLLAFALYVPQDDHRGMLEPARGLSDADQPDLWQHDLSNQLVQWIELGQPDERRLAKACGRAERVVVFSYSAATPVWWAGIANKVARLSNLTVWQITTEQSKALAAMAKRGMQWQVTVQDGTVWVNDGGESLEITPQALMKPA